MLGRLCGSGDNLSAGPIQCKCHYPYSIFPASKACIFNTSKERDLIYFFLHFCYSCFSALVTFIIHTISFLQTAAKVQQKEEVHTQLTHSDQLLGDFLPPSAFRNNPSHHTTKITGLNQYALSWQKGWLDRKHIFIIMFYFAWVLFQIIF